MKLKDLLYHLEADFPVHIYVNNELCASGLAEYIRRDIKRDVLVVHYVSPGRSSHINIYTYHVNSKFARDVLTNAK